MQHQFRNVNVLKIFQDGISFDSIDFRWWSPNLWYVLILGNYNYRLWAMENFQTFSLLIIIFIDVILDGREIDEFRMESEDV